MQHKAQTHLTTNNNETKMSFSWSLYHWPHHKLSKQLILVQPLMEIYQNYDIFISVGPQPLLAWCTIKFHYSTIRHKRKNTKIKHKISPWTHKRHQQTMGCLSGVFSMKFIVLWWSSAGKISKTTQVISYLCESKEVMSYTLTEIYPDQYTTGSHKSIAIYNTILPTA